MATWACLERGGGAYTVAGASRPGFALLPPPPGCDKPSFRAGGTMRGDGIKSWVDSLLESPPEEKKNVEIPRFAAKRMTKKKAAHGDYEFYPHPPG